MSAEPFLSLSHSAVCVLALFEDSRLFPSVLSCFLCLSLALDITPLISLTNPQLLAALKAEATQLPSASFMLAPPSTAAACKQALPAQAGMAPDPAFMDKEGLVMAMAALHCQRLCEPGETGGLVKMLEADSALALSSLGGIGGTIAVVRVVPEVVADEEVLSEPMLTVTGPPVSSSLHDGAGFELVDLDVNKEAKVLPGEIPWSSKSRADFVLSATFPMCRDSCALCSASDA
jgi:hypothetical protein